jgi:hypothetical protein
VEQAKKTDFLKSHKNEFDGGKKAQNTTHGWDLVHIYSEPH